MDRQWGRSLILLGTALLVAGVDEQPEHPITDYDASQLPEYARGSAATDPELPLAEDPESPATDLSSWLSPWERSVSLTPSQDDRWGIPYAELSGVTAFGMRLHETLVRVKIFPHSDDLPPHGREQNPRVAVLRNVEACAIYPGDRQVPRRSGRMLQRAYVIALDVRKLTDPLYIRCHGTTTVERVGRDSHFSYVGDFWVRSSPGQPKSLEIVNVVPLENYLQGVLPAEVFPSWPTEALKSQAVAARTYALFHLLAARRRTPVPAFDVDDSVHYQAYTGTSQRAPETDLAIAATRGQVLSYQGRIIRAFYHADSGGHTESAEEIWGGYVPYTIARPEPAVSQHVRTMAWRAETTLAEVNLALRKQRVIDRHESIVRLETQPRDRTKGGRLKSVWLVLQDGRRVRASLPSMRRAFPLRSANFHIRQAQDQVSFIGTGSGHGVGLNQKGACVLAGKFAWEYGRILRHYYRDTTVCRIDGWSLSGVPSCQDADS